MEILAMSASVGREMMCGDKIISVTVALHIVYFLKRLLDTARMAVSTSLGS